MNILIIEDEVMMRDMVSRFCQKHGRHFILTAENLAEARQTLSEFVPDFVISDNRLPDGRGPDLFGAMREKNPKVFICLMSGDHKEPEGHGADVFLKKPVPQQELSALLTKVESLA